MFHPGESVIKLGLVGKNIKHSKSKSVYEKILQTEIEYTLFDIENSSELPELEDLFKKVSGLSITAPYKKDYTSFVEAVGEVSDLGIINCIRKSNKGYQATNTDFLAVHSFLKSHIENNDSQIIILGDGSMAQITTFSLGLLSKEYTQYSRKITPNFPSLDLSKLSENNALIINTCAREYVYNGPLSDDNIFWDYNYLHKAHNDRFANSSFQYIDGMDLLKNQAIHALSFWGINY